MRKCGFGWMSTRCRATHHGEVWRSPADTWSSEFLRAGRPSLLGSAPSRHCRLLEWAGLGLRSRLAPSAPTQAVWTEDKLLLYLWKQVQKLRKHNWPMRWCNQQLESALELLLPESTARRKRYTGQGTGQRHRASMFSRSTKSPQILTCYQSRSSFLLKNILKSIFLTIKIAKINKNIYHDYH